MKRGTTWAPILAVVLAACPLPQPLPAVQRVGEATIAPPRILAAAASPAQGLVRVGTSCGPGAVIPFTAMLEDPNVEELVQARWFVDYDAGSTGIQGLENVPPSPDGNPVRSLSTPYQFRLVDHDPALPHVVELVVSNGFHDVGADPLGSPVNRTPLPGYEVQVFRWTVSYDAAAPCP